MSIDQSFFNEAFHAKKRAREEIAETNKDVESYVSTKELIDKVVTTADTYTDPIAKEIAETLNDDLYELLSAVKEYITSADKHEHIGKTIGSDITPDSKDKLVEVSRDRTATHNLLMGDLNTMKFKLDKLGIDNNIIYAIVGEDRKLDLTQETDRRAVERWARNVAKYLATVGQTTLEE